MMDFECVNVLEDLKKNIEISTEFNTTLYVDENLFFKDMGYKSHDCIIKQFNIDAPRCHFVYNGKRIKKYCSDMKNVSVRDLAYCTQAVLGLPFQLLFCNLGETFDSRNQMYVKLQKSGNVVVTKHLKTSLGTCFIKTVVRVTKYNNYAKKAFLWFDFVQNYTVSNSCSKQVNVYVYFTHFKKHLPQNQVFVLDCINVNTGFAHVCRKDSVTDIVIFRQEEWYKVLLHETFHNFGLDFLR